MNKIFDLVEDGIFSADGHLSEVHRSITMSFFTCAQIYHMIEKSVRKKNEKGLVPTMVRLKSEHGIEVDLHDIF